jgi:aminoglycoside phosphotransferase (APT) family kinase protein
MTETFDQGAVEAWLAPHLGADAVRMLDARRPSGQGFSAETVMFTAECARGDERSSERLVLRLENPEPAIYPPQAADDLAEIEIQHRVMTALDAHSAVPVAPLVGYEADPGVAGRPFFVMRFVEGQVPIESPVYTSEGFFVDASPDERRRLVTGGLRTMAEVHAVDWRAAGLDWLVPPDVTPGSRAQLDLWECYGAQELRGRQHPLLDRAWAWLHDELPDDREVGLCWGDPRPGNIIWRDFEPVCATDFEATCISAPEMDLGWWLMFDRTTHELAGTSHLPGEPNREEQRRLYLELSGRDAVDTTAHEVFAAARYAVIVVRVMNRWEQRGDLPADHTIWRDNPASACLEVLLGEIG